MVIFLIEYYFKGKYKLNKMLKEQIESRLKVHIRHFLRYAGFSHLTLERKEIVVGTFAYLRADNDLIPDDVPNIGFLDDLMVFVEASKYFLATGKPITGVCNPQELLEDIKFVEKNAGLMFGDNHFSIETIRKLGKANIDDLPALTEYIKEKYKNFGDIENDES